ncbi:hypothetical protein [Variovorax sp. HJSM1_2]|uniref:nSTAND3 domain-containing NTPase n=1 Tax=Variovorax sp. HJSM1_2 TaxID=3366263 RepID=UPI003BD5F968
MTNAVPLAQGPIVDLAIHTLGWKAFQDLCAQICSVAFSKTVSIYREAQDGGQDAVFFAHGIGSEGIPGEVTVQCKFSSKENLRLRANDVTSELATVRELTASGRAKIYYLITSQGVDAPVAAEIRARLAEAGVVEPHVLGREWLTQQIRASARLRALVPRVYGLGDLSTILDERCAEQTLALLGHLRPSLKVYVPTSAHRQAIHVLSEHKIALLLGAPATGKSMLAAILATTAIDGESHACMKCDGPLELAARWNPNEKNRLYWVDDAFGPNQLRSDYVDGWIAAMPKVKAAIELGNRFILTSRSHIWFGAKPKLGTRNLPVLADGRAVVDLGTLSPEEREQILYNHVKAGNQTALWKARLKGYLPQLAKNPMLLPEIARRLGDPSFTKGIRIFSTDLDKFVSKPEEFLKQTIQELDDAHQAAMTLVFLRQGKLPAHELSGGATNLVSAKYDVTSRAIAEALPQLNRSFLSVRQDGASQIWGFVHPTFTDAISSMLSARPDLVELYVQGARLETLLTEVVCEGASSIRDAVVVPVAASGRLVERLLGAPDEPDINRLVFGFLATRASDAVVTDVIASGSEILRRESSSFWRASSDPRLRLLARVNKLHLLPDDIRWDVAYELERFALQDFDVSFLDDDDILALLQPTRILNLGLLLAGTLDSSLPTKISEIAEQADPDYDVPDQFDQVRSFVRQLRDTFLEDENFQTRLQSLDVVIDDAISEVSKKKTPEEEPDSWPEISPAKVAPAPKGRSMFSDVDE